MSAITQQWCAECNGWRDHGTWQHEADKPSELPSSTGSPTGTEAEVCADITARQAMGIAKYGVSVAANPLNLKAWLQHAYEETLDQAIYLKRAIRELENDRDQRRRAADSQPETAA